MYRNIIIRYIVFYSYSISYIDLLGKSIMPFSVILFHQPHFFSCCIIAVFSLSFLITLNAHPATILANTCPQKSPLLVSLACVIMHILSFKPLAFRYKIISHYLIVNLLIVYHYDNKPYIMWQTQL